MYQIIMYDNSCKERPRIINKEDFDNEECAWSWYDSIQKRKGKHITLEFKIVPKTQREMSFA